MERRSDPHQPGAPHEQTAWTRDEFDALADLFLDEQRPRAELRLVGDERSRVRAPEPSGDRPTPNAQRPIVEALVLGHLPVLASAWVGQHARARAAELGGPVALVRIQAGQASVELVGDAGQLEGVRPDASTPGTLEGALRVVEGRARSIVVRVEEPDEPSLLDDPRVSLVTVLTGADDAALVATYRTLKLLGHKIEWRDQSPVVRVAIMGSPADKAREAKGKLDRTLATFQLGDVAVTVGPQRIGAGASLALHRGTSPGVAALVGALPIGPSRAHADEPGACSRIGVPADATAQANAQPAPSSPAPTEPVGTPPRAPRDLAQHLPGLTGIAPRCPYAPQVELAVDSEGGLHLLAMADGSGTSRAEQGAGEAVARLVSVAGWAFDHAELIRLGSPKTPLASGSSGEVPATVLHLLTDQPREVRRLLESGVRVHQVSCVRVSGQTAWICRDLN